MSPTSGVSVGTPEAGAIFGAGGLDSPYRYVLWRVWDCTLLPLVCCLLNPSKATHEIVDPTVQRMMVRAGKYNCGGVYVLNLFALRSTDPKLLYLHPNPEGVNNDYAIALVAGTYGNKVLCGWGEHGRLNNRSNRFRMAMGGRGIELTCLKCNQSGEPQHPLYIGYEHKPVPWTQELK
jgi:hypothetical protein